MPSSASPSSLATTSVPASAPQARPALALIGAGVMGSRIAARLLAAGYALTVCNRSVERLGALQAAGAAVAPTAAAAAAAADIVFTCLRGDEAELQATLGHDGLLAAMPPTALHVALSTMSPDTALRLATAHRDHGSRFLCCQMQGRAQAAEAGQLLLWASGSAADLAAARPILDTFAARICHLGARLEQAPAAKLAVNMLMFANIQLFAETAAYLQHCGVDSAPVMQALTESTFAAPLFKGIAGALRGNHAPDGTSVATALRDLQLLLAHAAAVGARLPAAAAVAGHYEATASAGHAALSQSAVILPLQAGAA